MRALLPSRFLLYKRFWIATKGRSNANRENWYETSNVTGWFIFALVTPTLGRSHYIRSSRS
jgi:hypothetical protein